MFLTIIVFLFILGFLILTHEFGHFIVAKKSGIRIEEFGIGFPPRIWGKKKGETVYSINLIPFGGFVKLYGEDEVDKKYLRDPQSFSAKPIWVKLLVIIAGVAMNFLLASLIFYFLLAVSGFVSQQFLVFDYQFPLGRQKNFPLVLAIEDGSPAVEIGIKPGNVIISGNGARFRSIEEFISFVDEKKGENILLKVRDFKSQEIREVSVVPRISFPEGEGPLGVRLGEVAELRYENFFEKTLAGFLHSLNFAHYSISAFGHLIKLSFQEETIKPLSSSVVGPVGILAITKITLKEGIIALLNLMALISLALAVVNIFPFPALDGGRLIFIGLEGLTGKKIPLEVEKNINLIGFVLLILLLILISYKDIVQFKDILF
ncbi:MAG: site-2 protease family protein [Candidatus Nealsonbacteria bacterium]|nr:site-2 protease family protein [Candidatus Nealsonbacteria bacterium]